MKHQTSLASRAHSRSSWRTCSSRHLSWKKCTVTCIDDQQKGHWFSQGGKIFRTELPCKRVFLQLVKPGGQSHPHSRPICQGPGTKWTPQKCYTILVLLPVDTNTNSQPHPPPPNTYLKWKRKMVLITAIINSTHHNRKTCCWCGGYKWTHPGTDMLIESNFPVSKKKVKNGNCLILFKLIYVCLTFSKIGLLKLINKPCSSSSLNKRNSNHDGGPLYIWFSYRFVQL